MCSPDTAIDGLVVMGGTSVVLIGGASVVLVGINALTLQPVCNNETILVIYLIQNIETRHNYDISDTCRLGVNRCTHKSRSLTLQCLHYDHSCPRFI